PRSRLLLCYYHLSLTYLRSYCPVSFSVYRPFEPLFSFLSRLPPPPRPPLFPYTTLFRSIPPPACDPAVPGNPDMFTDYGATVGEDRKSTRLNSSHEWISYAVFCLKKKKQYKANTAQQ